ncbi:MAG TPA: PTS sugar transporter subunit IIA [Spirochaetota bacterium]|nr:PTS sugar transporter subunit IIA [Spirochaetota bacterium]HOS39983.1 PTS sugar transporter subunit IIA [Spirochaetota bacterium]HPU90227.1 PTS sugar transporter subunit IIA [Spirochaetota bacterium]
MNLEDFFPSKHIIFLKSNEKQLVIKEMLQKLHKLEIIENVDRYYAQVIHRESLENTGIGKGFAIPHVRTDTVSNLIVMFGICRAGIEYNAFDQQPVKYLLLSLFPTDMSTKYLYLVGMMASIFSEKSKTKLLDSATTAAKVYSALNTEGRKYLEVVSSKDRIKKAVSAIPSGVPSSNLDLIIRLDRLYQITDGKKKNEASAKKIAELQKLIDNRSLTYYERMRQKCQNPFSIVDNNSCSGCHMVIPAADANRMKRADKISLCPHCGRFLIFI